MHTETSSDVHVLHITCYYCAAHYLLLLCCTLPVITVLHITCYYCVILIKLEIRGLEI